MDGNLRSLEHRSKVALSHEVLREAVVRFSHRECARIFHCRPVLSFMLCTVPYSTPGEKECPM